jgi:hypothetical protein
MTFYHENNSSAPEVKYTPDIDDLGQYFGKYVTILASHPIRGISKHDFAPT